MASERLAIEHFQYNLSGYELCFQRKKIMGVEVDLAFEKQAVLHLVEVKTYREGFPLISKSQLLRLKRVAGALSTRHWSGVRLHIVSVESNGHVLVHWDIGDEV